MNEPLPALHGATLDEVTLDALFTDIGHLTHVEEVRLKVRGQVRADEQTTDLETARALLQAGQAAGVQIWYRHQGQAWVDTLLATPGGVKLVRMAAPARSP